MAGGIRRQPFKAESIYNVSPPSLGAGPKIGLSAAVGANFALENEIFSGARALTKNIEQFLMPSTPNYRPPLETLGPEFSGQKHLFTGMRSREQFDHMRSYLQNELKWREAQAQRPGVAFFAGTGAAMLGPSAWIGPGAALKYSKSFLRGAKIGAGYGALGAAAQESVLSSTQTFRTGEESAINIAASAVLSSVLGGGAGVISKRAYRKHLQRAKDFLGSESLGRTVIRDPESGLYWGWTPEANQAYENFVANIVESRLPFEQIDVNARLRILKEHGQSFKNAEEVGRYVNDTGEVIVDTNFLDVIYQLDHPYRPDLNFEDEARAALESQQRLRTPVEQVGEQALPEAEAGYGSVIRNLIERARSQVLEFTVPEDVAANSKELLETVMSYHDLIQEVTGSAPLGEEFIEEFAAKLSEFEQLRAGLRIETDLMRVQHRAERLAREERLNELTDSVVEDFVRLKGVDVSEEQTLAQEAIHAEIRKLKLAIRNNIPRTIQSAAKNIRKALGEPIDELDPLLGDDPEASLANLDASIEEWAARRAGQIESLSKEIERPYDAFVRRAQEVVKDNERSVLRAEGELENAREQLLFQIFLGEAPPHLEAEYQLAKNQPRVRVPGAGTKSQIKTVAQVRAAARRNEGVFGLIVSTDAQTDPSAPLGAYLVRARSGRFESVVSDHGGLTAEAQLRQSAVTLTPTQHFGNPFYQSRRVRTGGRNADVNAYNLWLRGERYSEVEPERRAWILNLIDEGHLDNQVFLHHNDFWQYRETMEGPGSEIPLWMMSFTPDETHLHKLVAFIRERRGLRAANSREVRAAEDALIEHAMNKLPAEEQKGILEGWRLTSTRAATGRQATEDVAAPAPSVPAVASRSEIVELENEIGDVLDEIRDRATPELDAAGAPRHPVLSEMRRQGGVATVRQTESGSWVKTELASQLASMDVTPKTHPGLFHDPRKRAKWSASKRAETAAPAGSLDAFDWTDTHLFTGEKDEYGRPVNANEIYDAISQELSGSIRYTELQQEKILERTMLRDQVREELARLDLDVDTMSNREIAVRMVSGEEPQVRDDAIKPKPDELSIAQSSFVESPQQKKLKADLDEAKKRVKYFKNTLAKELKEQGAIGKDAEFKTKKEAEKETKQKVADLEQALEKLPKKQITETQETQAGPSREASRFSAAYNQTQIPNSNAGLAFSGTETALLKQQQKLASAQEELRARSDEAASQRSELAQQGELAFGAGDDLGSPASPLHILRDALFAADERLATVEGRQLEPAIAELTTQRQREFGDLAKGLQTAMRRIERQRLRFAEAQERRVAARGALQEEMTRLRQSEQAFLRLDGTSELNELNIAEARLVSIREKSLLSEAQAVEAGIERMVRNLAILQEELALETEGVADSRPLVDFDASIINARQAAAAAELDLHTVSELLTAVGNGERIRGIGPKTIDKLRASALEHTQTIRTAESNLLSKIESDRARLAEQQDQVPPPPPPRTDPETGEPVPPAFGQQEISVQAGGLSWLKWLGMAGSTIEQRIMHSSPYKESKRILMEIKDMNLIVDQNVTGEVVNPLPVEIMVAQLMGMANRSLRTGPHQQWARFVEGLNTDGSASGLTSDAIEMRSVAHAQWQFRSYVGVIMHDPTQIHNMPPELAPYIKEAASVMRRDFYIPMLGLWEKVYKTDTRNTDIFSYLLRDWNVGKIVENKEEFVELIVQDMLAKFRKQVQEAVRDPETGELIPEELFDPEFQFVSNQPAHLRRRSRRGQLIDNRTIDGRREITNIPNWMEHQELKLRAKIERWVDAITKSPGGRMLTEDLSSGDLGMEPGRRRAGARRAFHYYNEVSGDVDVDLNVIFPYMNTDIDELTTLYARTRIPDLAVISKFGDLGASKAFASLEAEWKAKMAEVEANSSVVADVEKEKAWLTTMYDRDKRDLAAALDLTRNVFNQPVDPTSVEGYSRRVAASLKHITHMRIGGMFGISALGDLGSSAMVNGFSNTTRALMEEFVTDANKILPNMPEADLKALAIFTEDYMYQRLSFAFDVDVHGPTPTMIEQGIATGSQAMAHASLLLYWTNFIKGVGAKASLRKIGDAVLEVAAGNAESYGAALMRRSGGFTPEDFEMLKLLWHQHGEGWDGGPRVSFGVELWPDKVGNKSTQPLKQRLRQQILADAARTAPAPTVGDKPTWFHHWFGSLLTMFKGFGFGYTHKLLIPAFQGLPHGDLRALAVIGFGIGLGSLVYMLRHFADTGEVDSDVNRIIQQGVVRSDMWGKLASVDEFNSTFTPMPSVMGTLAPGTHHAYESPSFWEGAVETVGGPAFGTVKQGFRAANFVAGTLSSGSLGTATPEEIRAVRRIAPYQNLAYVNWLFDVLQNGLQDRATKARMSTVGYDIEGQQ